MFEKHRARYSYTALDTFHNCPWQYYLKYIAGRRTEENSLAMSTGTILHKAKELVSLSLINGEQPDYEGIKKIVWDGWTGKNKSNGEPEIISGMSVIKRTYWEDWLFGEEGVPSYDERMETFFSHIEDEEHDPEWFPIAAEQGFSFEYGDATLFGVIDKIEENREGKLRIVDYKSSKKVYDAKKLTSPLQLYIYWLAAQKLYPDKEIDSCWYDFIMLGEKVQGGTKGWTKRCEKKLDKILYGLNECKRTGIWKPHPTPLCYWCSYCERNPKADKTTCNACRYYSLWTPQSKSFEVVQKWEEGTTADVAEKKGTFEF